MAAFAERYGFLDCVLVEPFERDDTIDALVAIAVSRDETCIPLIHYRCFYVELTNG